MKKITLSADDNLIDKARLVAQSQHKTLNTAFQEFLQQYVGKRGAVQPWMRLCAVSSMCVRAAPTLGAR